MVKDDSRQKGFAQQRSAASPSGEDLTNTSPDRIRDLVHELRTHQIELEMQNEELRRAQEELVDSRNRYSDLYDRAPVAFVTVSDTGLVVEANLTCADMLRVERTALINHPFSAFVVPDDNDIFYRHRQDVAASGRRQTCNLRMLRRDADPLWTALDSAIVGRNGGHAQLRVAIIDITDRRLAEEALRVETALSESYINSLPGLFYVFDEQRFVRWNREWRNITGYTDEELAGKYWTDFFGDEDRVRIDSELQRTFREGAAEVEADLVTKHGRAGRYLFTGSRKRLNGKDYVVGFGIDVSERTRVREELDRYRERLEDLVSDRTAELQRSNEELQAFGYSVSHDLRAPLRAMNGFSNVIREEYGELLDDRGRDYLARIGSSSVTMGHLIDGLLRLARLSQREMQVRTVMLDTLATDILADLRETDAERTVEVRIQPALEAAGDPELLKVVLVNLLANAWKFSRRRARALIEVGALDSDGQRTFFVRDNGVGFDMDYAGSIFGTFQRLHRSEGFEGVGVGLRTVQRIVARHGGRIWVEAVPDRGATFYFTLGVGPC